MKALCAAILAVFIPVRLIAETDLSYYLPAESYDPEIPAPSTFIGHEIGAWHLTHDRLVYYLRALAEQSDRLVYQEYARSWEGRPLFHLLITSPENHARIEVIRSTHLKLSDPEVSGTLDTGKMPLVVRMGYGIHGNESSASNSAALMAYYMAASSAPGTLEWLDKMVILLDPCLNPDGFNRHASWVNMHKSRVPMPDDISRGYREEWPGGRTNHYWFDLNRDWLLLVHPESRGRVRVYHEWKPNVQTDHHEMGAANHFFFQPGVPSRINPLTPPVVGELTHKIGTYHQSALDQTGSIYFTEERFDDFYYGKGSSYPDVCGGIGILFEQAGTRGFERSTPNGTLTFPFAIRNQVTVSFSTLKASYELREELLDHQRQFYQDARNVAASSGVKAYVFEPSDPSTGNLFLSLLMQHQIRVHHLEVDTRVEGYNYRAGQSFVVPLDQPQVRLVKSFFEPVTQFEDSVFYDVSTWILPYAMNIPYAPVRDPGKAATLPGAEVEDINTPAGRLHEVGHPVGYMMPWVDLYAPKALFRLQDQELMTMVCQEPMRFEIRGETRAFPPGSIFIPAYKQQLSPAAIHEFMQKLAVESGLDIHAIPTSFTGRGPDLGSRTILPLQKPRMLLLTGNGISSGQAGEIWHHLDTRMDMPVALIEPQQLNAIDLAGYTHLLMPAGSYGSIRTRGVEEIRRWLGHGGTIIATGSANRWLADNDLATLRFKSAPRDSVGPLPYAEASDRRSADRIPGSFFQVELDLSHPVNFGIPQPGMAIFRRSTLTAVMDKRPYAYPVRYADEPLLSGYVPEKRYAELGGSPAVVVGGLGRGRIISFLDDPLFRGFMYGSSRLFMNAIFFGPTLPSHTVQ